MTSLNPVQRVDQHLVEAIQVHEPATGKESAIPRITTLIERLGIRKNRLESYPHQLSGGMRQIGPIEQVFDNPLHPYTKGLLQSVPSISLDERDELFKMSGEPPNLTHPPSGCRFHPRCPAVMDFCRDNSPTVIEAAPNHFTHCWLYKQ